jgi:poly-gamma-glutamate capsule biosynthesis protein CapA/YwtB (metallophosphatase superfamily)
LLCPQLIRGVGVLLVVLAVGAGAEMAVAGATTAAGAAHRGASRPGDNKPKPPPPPPPAVTLEWVGDIALSTQRGLPPGGLARALAPVARQLQNADLTTGNLEGTLSVSGPSKCDELAGGSCFAFQAPPSTAGQLRALGFDLVNQANNHSLDYGYTGRAQTVAALDHAGVAHTGFPGQITVLKANGIKVAFLGFAPYSFDGNLLDVAAAKALVRQARKRAQLVVVLIHAGAEGADQLHTPYGTQYYLGEDRGNARGFAHAVINAGASIVLGSGPHVIRGIERYRNRLIAYSLGNFVGYHTLGAGGVLSDSAILRVTLDTPWPGRGRRLDPGHARRRAAAARPQRHRRAAGGAPLKRGLPPALSDRPERSVRVPVGCEVLIP